MIRKLSEQDRQQVMEFLSEEPSINLFIIGDIEAFGFEEEFQELWGQYNDEAELEGVLLRYHENFIPYYKDTTVDMTGFKDIVLKNDGKTFMSGKESVLQYFSSLLPNHNVKSTYFCEMKEQLHTHQDGNGTIKIATVEDAGRISNLLLQIVEFNTAAADVERIAHKILTKTGRIYYIENEEGEMITIAQTTAENSRSAMVVGVATLEAYRGKGLVSQCLSKLCEDMLAEGKSLCLFYDNPKAGKIYHKLGFQTIDNWIMVTE